MDRGLRDDGAVTAERQGKMPVFALFVGTILTERLSDGAESAFLRYRKRPVTNVWISRATWHMPA
jgi:hypothetical protein